MIIEGNLDLDGCTSKNLQEVKIIIFVSDYIK